MDWLLPLRAGDHNPECQHAIRSWVANAGMTPGTDRLVVVGDCPAWLRPDLFIPGNGHRSGPVNVWSNIRDACLTGDLTEQAIVVNDDFYAMEFANPRHIWHRGPLLDHVKRLARSTWWFASMRQTIHVARKHADAPLSYELHRPLLIDTAAMGRVLADSWDGRGVVPQWRTVYGNALGIGGERTTDGKVIRSRDLPPLPWWSSTDGSWRTHETGRIIRETFTTPSPWEYGADVPANERTKP